MKISLWHVPKFYEFPLRSISISGAVCKMIWGYWDWLNWCYAMVVVGVSQWGLAFRVLYHGREIRRESFYRSILSASSIKHYCQHSPRVIYVYESGHLSQMIRLSQIMKWFKAFRWRKCVKLVFAVNTTGSRVSFVVVDRLFTS